MVETEVEVILGEIRDRVRATQAARTGLSATSNGAANTDAQSERTSAETLALINSYLTTTGRAWDQLPPVVSNRSGISARLELWLKRHFRRATRWFAWEQINFNAAVHQALRDLLPAIASHDQALRQLRAELDETKRQRQEEALKAEVQAIRAQSEAQNKSLNARFSDLVREIHEREDRLVSEQRVCFKQLSLEGSEAAVLEERARRKTASLLAELQMRIDQLEKDKSGE
jgi:hypothetical protein